MTDPSDLRWSTAARHPGLQAALSSQSKGTLSVGSPLRAISDDPDMDEDVRYVSGLLSTVARFMPNGEDWTNPYGPFASFGDRRSPIPADFTEVDIAVLAEIAELVPDLILRSRILDILALAGNASLRPARHAAQLQALADHGVTAEAMAHDGGQWERSLAVGVRFRDAASAQLEELERQLVEAATTSHDGALAVRAARVLGNHGLGTPHASTIAAHLAGRTHGIESFAAQRTLEVAADWYRRAKDPEGAEDATYAIIRLLLDDAASADASRASIHLEAALKRLRTLSKAARERLGIADLAADIARRIRESGAAAIGQMKVFAAESGDLSSHVAELLVAIRSDDPLEALQRFAKIQPFASLSAARNEAEEREQQFPLTSVFGRRTLSADGRTIYRSQAGKNVSIYGEKASTWESMIEHYQLRIGLVGGVVVPPAWRQLSTDHRFHIGDFQTLAASSAIVPSSHEGVFARGLHYGYSGDFGTAVHLIVPALEALVRLHLANAGERTSVISSDGNEMELGLSKLMENERVVEIFGEDVSFELRALLCGPIGPNLRNEVAHGLIGDRVFGSGASVYLWWLTLKLVFMPYWNSLHDPEAAEAREPAAPGSDSDQV